MQKIITRTFCLDGDICDIVFRLDEASGKYLGDYPDFSEQPRYTPNGYPWVEAVNDDCPLAESIYPQEHKYNDCGTCKYFQQEKSGDLIGICTHEGKRIAPTTQRRNDK